MDLLDTAKQFVSDLVKQGWPVFWARQEEPEHPGFVVKIEADDTELCQSTSGILELSDEAVERLRNDYPECDFDVVYWCGDGPTHVEVSHTHRPAVDIPVDLLPARFRVVGASVTSSDEPPYDASDHKTLDEIEAEADATSMGQPMALFSGTCRWWTTRISDCHFECHNVGMDRKIVWNRPCCPHCGEPVVMEKLNDFLGNARMYAHTFGRIGLWALELAHASNLGRLMCLTDWDMYADAADAHARMVTHAD